MLTIGPIIDWQKRQTLEVQMPCDLMDYNFLMNRITQVKCRLGQQQVMMDPNLKMCGVWVGLAVVACIETCKVDFILN